MKIEINLTNEQAAEIKAALLKSSTETPPAMPSEPALPESPNGFHPAIMGPIAHPSCGFSQDIARLIQGIWNMTGWDGSSDDYYALRKGSEIARMNGLEPEEKPEPRKVREWEINNDGLSAYPIAIPVPFNQKRIEPGCPVMAREILPGEPTPEQVQELAAQAELALETLRRNNKHWLSLESTLAPFRKEGA
jgi:hypothetical protein